MTLMQIRQCLFIICVLVLTNCRTTKNDPIESSTTTTSTQEFPSSNSDNSEIRGDSVSQDRSLAHLGITYLTEEQGKVMLDTAKQTGTILSCDELNKSYLNMRCLVIAEFSGYGHSSSPNPPGMVSILNDQILFTGEVFEIEE
jgi:hypothetical protein